MHQNTWDAFKFISAIKGDTFTGFANVPILGHNYYLVPETAHKARQAAGYVVAAQVESLIAAPEVVIIPVPSSDGVDEASVLRSAPGEIATYAAQKIGGARVEAIVRFRRPQRSARKGGSRDAETLYAEMVCDSYPSGQPAPVVLLDDVMTSRSHMRAALTRLSDLSIPVTVGVCVGRTMQDESARPAFAWTEETIYSIGAEPDSDYESMLELLR